MLVALYFAISMLSAFLLFLVQPMAAKAVLPVLGGAPFVWNGCMLFFQTLLLGGYLYSHHVVRRLPPRKQVWVHLSVLVAALVFFPTGFTGVTGVDSAMHPLLWLMVTLLASIAAPFFALSATAPMIQGWFAVAGHKRSANPYFLYAASNLGSFGSLIVYLLVVEPNFTHSQQLTIMHLGFALLVALFMTAGVRLYRNGAVPNVVARHVKDDAPPVRVRQIAYWLALSFVPSSLLYGVTQYISTDVASMPLLWVLPLALYLLTFVLVFAEKPIGLYTCRWLHLPAAAGMVLIYLSWLEYDMWMMMMHMVLFFIVVMACHGYLSQSRPAASQLTNFYLWVSFGGVLGGIFNIFVAPHLFTEITEYPLMMFISGLVCIPFASARLSRLRWQSVVPSAAVLLVSAAFYFALKHNFWIGDKMHVSPDSFSTGLWQVISELWRMMIVVLLCFGAQRLRLINTSVFVALLVGAQLLYTVFPDMDYLFNERNIFGVNRVFYDARTNTNLFRHGTTDHGKQSRDEASRLKPVSYYVPLSMVFDALDEDKRTRTKPVAALGLGVGTIACYGKPGEQFDIFEIDPLVQKIATDGNLFTYLRDCKPDKRIIIGDARINLGKQPDKRYSLVIADTFSSDAVPVHMLTQEAIAMYLDKVVDGGVVAVHITNRHLNLGPVISSIAGELGAHAYYYYYDPGEDYPLGDPAEWIMVTRNEAFLPRLQKINPEWHEMHFFDPEYLWRDDFSNIWRVIRMQTNLWGLFS